MINRTVLKNKKFLVFLLSLVLSFFVSGKGYSKTFIDLYSEYSHDLQNAESMTDEDYRAFAIEFKTLTDSYAEGAYFNFAKNQNTENEYFSVARNLIDFTETQEFFEKESAAKLSSLMQDLILAENKSLKKREKLYQNALLSLSFLSIFLLAMILMFIRQKNKIEKIQKEQEAEKIAMDTLIAVQESERKRIYQDLHDTVSQNLKISQIFLTNLRQSVRQTENVETVDRLIELEKESLRDIKIIIDNLIPPELSETDFKDSIHSLCSSMQASSPVPIKLFIQNEVCFDSFSLEQRLNIYRIIQESITNSIKHSCATEISVIIHQGDAAVKIFITDDGKGFSKTTKVKNEAQDGETHIGIKGIKSRAATLNASLEIISEKQSGTEIKLEIPM
ncbi:MAG: sensor histidine kinase [Treponema sp.]